MTGVGEHVVVPLDPLVDDPLVPVHHWTAEVLHTLVLVAGGCDGVPEQGRALPRGDTDALQREHRVASLLRAAQVDHEGHQSLPGYQPRWRTCVVVNIVDIGVTMEFNVSS